MKKSVLLCLSFFIAQHTYAQETNSKSELTDLAVKAKEALKGSVVVWKKHPLPAVKLLLGSFCLFYGVGSLLACSSSITQNALGLAKGVPMTALGIFLMGNGMDDIDRS